MNFELVYANLIYVKPEKQLIKTECLYTDSPYGELVLHLNIKSSTWACSDFITGAFIANGHKTILEAHSAAIARLSKQKTADILAARERTVKAHGVLNLSRRAK
jgi:hypothetical protein